MPRVLWLIKGLGPGGAETLLAAAARAHDLDEFHVECAYVLPYKDHLAEELERAGVRCHCLSRTANDANWPMRLRRLLRSEGFDVVHSHSPLPAAIGRLVAATLPRASRPALVSTEHNAWNTFAAPTRWLNRLTIAGDSAVYAVSEETRQSMTGRAREKCVTLQHGIDVASVGRRAADREEMRRELGIAPGELVIGTVANYREQKDYPNLLRAAAELRQRNLPARVVAVGQGPLEVEIEAMRDDLGLSDMVLLTGWRPDATRVMSAFDVFTLASSWEGLPVALMEALALGLPVVATRVGGVSEALGDDDAVLVQPGDPRALADAWAELVEEPDRRAEFGSRSRALAGAFDVRGAVDEYEACYRRLVPAAATRIAPSPTVPPRRSVPAGIELRQATDDDRPAILALLTRSLGWHDDERYAALFEWKHDRNPFGPSPMWIACDGDRVVGLRVFMRWQFRRGGETLRAVRAVDTATDPDYQGKGLFTALTLQGVDELRNEGVDFVFNTPNSQSLPGYLKMGWQIVGSVPASFRPRNPRSLAATARARVPAELWSSPLAVGMPFDEWLGHRSGPSTPEPEGVRTVCTDRSDEFLAWRYGTPMLAYRALPSDAGALVLRGRRRGAAGELVIADSISLDTSAADRGGAVALRRSGFDHALRCGASDVRHGFVPLPGGGPVLTFRSLNAMAMPPLTNWHLTMGDVELF